MFTIVCQQDTVSTSDSTFYDRGYQKYEARLIKKIFVTNDLKANLDIFFFSLAYDQTLQ